MSAGVLVFVICVACCVVGHTAILYSVIRHHGVAPVDPQVPRSRLSIEILWAVIPALVLAFLLTASWARVRANDGAKPGVIMKIAR